MSSIVGNGEMMKNTFEMSPSMAKKWDDLLVKIKLFETALATKIDQTNGNAISAELELRTRLTALTPIIMEQSSGFHSWARGQVAEMAMADEKVIALKDTMQRNWVQGKLTAFEARFVRAKEATEKLDASIKVLISMLSFEKELINKSVHHQ